VGEADCLLQTRHVQNLMPVSKDCPHGRSLRGSDRLLLAALPRTPEQGTFTPEHDSMHGTHARHEPLPEAGATQELKMETASPNDIKLSGERSASAAARG